jgi:hypothetical protein
MAIGEVAMTSLGAATERAVKVADALLHGLKHGKP